MRAVRVHTPGDPAVLQLDEIPMPEPGPDQILIEVEAAGVNFIEVYQRDGAYPMQRPFTPGSEAGGVVRKVGARVTGIKVGHRIVTTSARGSYAEYAIVPADRAVRIPRTVSSRTAAAVLLQGMTAHYLTASTVPLSAGDKCLIHAAAGGVGLLLCQIAKRRGAMVIATASTEEKRELARRAGADEVIDYTTTDFAAAVRRLTGGAGVRVVYDSVGKDTFDRSLDSLAPRGTLVLFGQSSGAVPPFDPQILNRKGSLFLTRPTLNDYIATREELHARASLVLGWVADGSLTVRIGAEFSLEDAANAHRALEGRRSTGKVVLIP